MNDELNASEPMVKSADDTWSTSLSCATVSRPASVHELAIPFDPQEFQDPDFRHGFAANHLLSFLPTQLRALRKCDELPQKSLAVKLKTQQSAVSRAEQVDCGHLNISTAIKIGEALDRPFIAYWGTYSELLQHVSCLERNSPAFLASPSFAHDPGFRPGTPPLPSAINAETIFRVQKVLFKWLDTERPDPLAFLRFLAGFDLPVMAAETPAVNVILRAVREWGIAGAAWTRFLRAVANSIRSLGDRIDDGTTFVMAEPLFRFCSEVEGPDHLSQPLENLLDMLDSRASSLTLDLRAAYTAALVRNPSPELHVVLSEGEAKHPVLFFGASVSRETAAERARKTWRLDPKPEVMRTVDRIWGVSVSRPPVDKLRSEIAAILSHSVIAKAPERTRLYLAGSLLYSGLKLGNWMLRTSDYTALVLKDRFGVPIADLPKLAVEPEQKMRLTEVVERSTRISLC